MEAIRSQYRAFEDIPYLEISRDRLRLTHGRSFFQCRDRPGRADPPNPNCPQTVCKFACSRRLTGAAGAENILQAESREEIQMLWSLSSLTVYPRRPRRRYSQNAEFGVKRSRPLGFKT